jgi:hypothetical protein
MFRRKQKKQPPRTPNFLVPRAAIEAAFSRAALADDKEAMASADRLLRKCEANGVDYLAV